MWFLPRSLPLLALVGLFGSTGCKQWCQYDTQCESGEVCSAGFCETYDTNARSAGLCSTDHECAPQELCRAGACISRGAGDSPDGGASDGGGSDGGSPDGSVGDISSPGWCGTLDPEAVYIFGDVDGHGPAFIPAEGDALQYCFTIQGDPTSLVIRGSDGRLLYHTLGTTGARIWEYRPDTTDSENQGGPSVSDPAANDILLPSPPCDSSALARYTLDPTTWTTVHSCEVTPGAPWYDIDGNEVTPHTAWGDGMTFDDAVDAFRITPAGAPAVVFDQFAATVAATVRSTATGFLVATAAEGSAVVVPDAVWELDAAGTATKIGDYGALPTGFEVESRDYLRKISGAGVLYLGGRLDGEYAVARLRPDGSAGEIIYDLGSQQAAHEGRDWYLRYGTPRSLFTAP